MLDLMAIEEIKPPIFRVSYKGRPATFTASVVDGRINLDPVIGWNDLSIEWEAAPESILEAVDEVIYNAYPELWCLEEV